MGKGAVRLSEFICPAYREVYRAFRDNQYTHYWLCGGRGSGKSTFAAICLVLNVMRGNGNGVVFRKTENKIRESVYEQVLWVIDTLGVGGCWKKHVSAGELEYLGTGHRIYFRGVNDVARLKSIKSSMGRFSFAWFEETDEFSGADEIRSVLQSVIRGSGCFSVFYSYNPPRFAAHWINGEIAAIRGDKIVHRSSYLDIPEEWLGGVFLREAEFLRLSNPVRYKNEYLGETGRTGGEVFQNIVLRCVGEREINGFDCVKRGVDFGFAVDPFVYVCFQYDKKRRRIVIFYEIFEYALSNSRAAGLIWAENDSNSVVCADSAEPKSINEFRSYGLKVEAAKKGRDSVYYGIKFLQDLDEIVIDPERCPNAAREFAAYAYAVGKNGNFYGFGEKDNHSIDAVRYALESETCGRVAKVRDKKKFRGIL